MVGGYYVSHTVLCGGIRITDGRHVFPGYFHISVAAVRNRRLDNRDERLYTIFFPLADANATRVLSTRIISAAFTAELPMT